MWNFLKENTIGFLQDDTNSYSVMRLAFMLTILCALTFTGYLVIKEDVSDAIALFLSMFTAASGLKLIQKSQEIKENNADKKDQPQ